jgi:SulP family sulfate permease
MGIITAVWAGLLASLFGGSHYNIVGPTGALSGILAAYAVSHGAPSLNLVAILAGVLVLIAFALKLQRFLVFVPGNTIQGFTLGVAFIIAFNQFNFATGLRGLPAHERFVENLWESFTHLGQASGATVIVFLVFLAGLFALLKWAPKLPGAIALSPVGILLGYLASTGTLALPLQTLGQKFQGIHGTVFQMPSFAYQDGMLGVAFAVAVVAILETLLSAKIADGMTKTRHDKQKELLGLGLANVASGLMGGIPATAALARTALNVKSGATDKASASVSSFCIALISVVFLSTFQYIPLAVIAAILVFVAYRMMELHAFVRLFRHDRKSFGIALAVAFVTVYVDPIYGILFGTAVSLLLFIERLSRGQFELIVHDEHQNTIHKVTAETIEQLPERSDTLIYSIKGQLAFLNAQSHLARFEQDLTGYRCVILRLRELSFMDLDGVETLDEIIEHIRHQGREVYISGANPLIETLLRESAQYQNLKQHGHVFDRTNQAMGAIAAAR